MADEDLVVLDATGTQQKLSETKDAEGSFVGATCVTDPTTGAKLNVGTPQAQDGFNFAGENAIATASTPMLFNGTNNDRARNNVDAQSALLSLATAGAGNSASGDQTNYNGRGVQIGINITEIGASTSVVFTVRGKDVVSQQYYMLLASASLAETGFYLLTVYPGVTSVANQAAAQVVPRTWDVEATVTGVGGVTATVGASVIL